MADTDFTEADLALFRDLEEAASRVGVAPCLIGAGAIQLGSGRVWEVRLDRTTRDWDESEHDLRAEIGA